MVERLDDYLEMGVQNNWVTIPASAVVIATRPKVSSKPETEFYERPTPI